MFLKLTMSSRRVSMSALAMLGRAHRLVAPAAVLAAVLAFLVAPINAKPALVMLAVKNLEGRMIICFTAEDQTKYAYDQLDDTVTFTLTVTDLKPAPNVRSCSVTVNKKKLHPTKIHGWTSDMICFVIDGVNAGAESKVTLFSVDSTSPTVGDVTSFSSAAR